MMIEGIDVRTDTANQLAAIGAEFYRRGWMLGTAGNLSAKIGPDRYLITASGGHKGELQTSDFLALTVGSVEQSVGGRKSSAETVVHDAIYGAGLGRAVLHVHGPYCTLVSRRDIEAGVTIFEGWEYVKGLGQWDEGGVVEMPVVRNHHHLPSLADAVIQAARPDCPAVLVCGHGVYAWGETIADAQRHIECTEFLCQMSWEWGARFDTERSST